jgi:pimeloyl-ACP methyl ester carboxylesterase
MAERAAENMDNLNFAIEEQPIETVTSADGTTIAYAKSGTGPPVVIVGGGLNEKNMHATLAKELSSQFTVYNYDRRGRGASSHTPTERYTVDREIEDLDAVIRSIDEPANVFANCTGSMIAVPAAARGVPMAKLALYEPPYSGPKVPEGYIEELTGLLDAGRVTDAVALFLKWDALFTDDEIVFFKQHPIWPAFEAMASTMPYDSILSDDADAVPVDLLATIDVPTLVLYGSESVEWMQEVCRAVADGMPHGESIGMPRTGHLMDDYAGAKLLGEFFLR